MIARLLHGRLWSSVRSAAPRRPRSHGVSARRAMAALLLAALAACGGDAGAPLDEPWPLTLPDPAVLGYMAARLRPEETEQAFRLALGWAPAGLRSDVPVVGVRLDTKSFGGPMGFLLPLDDEAAFRASLQAAPGLESLGRGKYRLSLAPDSGAGLLLNVLAGLEAGSPMAILQRLGSGSATTFPFQLDVQDGWAIAVPSLEAMGVARRFLAATHGFADAPPRDLVLSGDLTRLRLVYAEQLRKFEEQLRGLASGAGTMGMLGGIWMLGMREHGGNSGPPINWELVWALKTMLDVGGVEAVQLQLTLDPGRRSLREDPPASPRRIGSDDDRSDPDGPGDDEAFRGIDQLVDRIGEDLRRAALRVRLAESSAPGRVVRALEPAPAVDGAFVSVAADPAAFPRAFADWFRPVGEVVHGRGPPCERWLDELAGLLSAWGGRCAAGTTPSGEVFLLSTVAPGRSFDAEAFERWLAPLLATARVRPTEGGGELADLLHARITTEPDGRQTLRTASGEVIGTCGRRGNVSWCVLDEHGTVPDALLDAIEAKPAMGPEGGRPALRVDTRWAGLDMEVQGRELTLHWLPDGRGG